MCIRDRYYRTTEVKRLEGLETALGISAEDWSDREGFEASYQPERVLSGTDVYKRQHRNTEEEKNREVEDERSKRQERACRPGA